MNADEMKRAASLRALELVHDGMVIGLGSGSTVAVFLELLGKKCSDGLQIKAVVSSTMTHDLALKHQVPMISVDDVEILDIAIDGADEVGEDKQLIKGGGAALLREKIVASMSNELVIIVDESKVVGRLGKHPLPVEVVPFGHLATAKKIYDLGYKGSYRMNSDGSLMLTENGHYLFDATSKDLFEDPTRDNVNLLKIPGVVETGFFIDMAGRIFIGKSDGSVELRD